MIGRALVLLLLWALAACRNEPTPPKAEAPPVDLVVYPPETETDSDNMLNMAYGASVVSRTGELNLDSSAASAIDGLATEWISAPGGAKATLVFSLLSLSRVKQVGVTSYGADGVRKVFFETSKDGRRWHDLVTMDVKDQGPRQLISVTPTVAQYIRVRILEPDHYYVHAAAFHALGEEIAPPDAPPFGGCWTINGRPARIVQTGARITGSMQTDPPTYFDGGTDNRVAMVMWIQGSTWGYGLLTRTPDGAQITGMRFYEETGTLNLGEAWLGERCAGSAPGTPEPPPAAIAQELLRRSRRYSAYGLVFDPADHLSEELSAPALDTLASLLPASQPFRVVAHELRGDTPEQNRRHTAARIESLRAALRSRGVNLDRVDFVASGSDWNGPPIGSAAQRLLASRVDLLFGR